MDSTTHATAPILSAAQSAISGALAILSPLPISSKTTGAAAAAAARPRTAPTSALAPQRL